MHTHEFEVSVRLVRSLVDDQFPEYRDRALSIVEPWGTDNAIWRLGPYLVVRLPRIKSAVGQIGFEAVWLSRLAPHLPDAVPEPVAVGEPGHGYPFPWVVHHWLVGEGATLQRMSDPGGFALDVADVVRQLQAVPSLARPRLRIGPGRSKTTTRRPAPSSSRPVI